MKNFVSSLGSEFQKLVWPKANEAFWLAILVIVIAIVVGYYLGFFDAVFAGLLKLIIG